MDQADANAEYFDNTCKPEGQVGQVGILGRFRV